MPDNDQMTDSAELRELRESLSGVAVPERPRLEAITARGRERRRRRLSRLTGMAVVGVAAVSALAIGLTGVHGRAPTLGTIRTASFTIHRNDNGTDTLTIHPTVLLDPAVLQSDLAKYGIPAKVTVGSFCSSDPAPAGLSQVVTGPGEGTFRAGSGEQPTITIDPAAVPAGTELSVGDFQLTTGEFAGEQQANGALIDTSSYTCTSTPPTLGPDASRFGLLYGGPGPS